jgi:hypothetical protein
MGWRAAVFACLGGLLLVGPACVETHRKGGALDRAMAKDTQEQFFQDDIDEMEEDMPTCPEGKVAHLKCEPGPCEWECR